MECWSVQHWLFNTVGAALAATPLAGLCWPLDGTRVCGRSPRSCSGWRVGGAKTAGVHTSPLRSLTCAGGMHACKWLDGMHQL